MQDAPVSGLVFKPRDPDVVIQVGRDGDVGVRHGPVGRDLERLDHLEDQIRLAHRPAFREGRDFRQIGAIAFWRTAVDPRGDRGNLGIGQARIVGELADVRVGAPRRHLSRHNLLLDGARPRPGIIVGNERHRRDRAGTMALDAAVVQNRGDVFGESGRRGNNQRRRYKA
jgi:hypothetical protein